MDDYLTLKEVANIYGRSTKTVRRWIARDFIIAYRIKGSNALRIDAGSLDGILEPVNYQGYVNRKSRK